MVLARTFDGKAVALQRTGRLWTYPSCLGQEVVAVGIGAAMAPGSAVSRSTATTSSPYAIGWTLHWQRRGMVTAHI